MKKIFVFATVFMTVHPCTAQRMPLQYYLERFAQVPSGPSTRYTLELLVAIPDTSRPNVLFSWTKGKLGHVFLGLCKTSGEQKVVEYLGFYARSPVLAFGTGLPVASRVSDNERHRYNAGICMRLSAAQFDSVLDRLRDDAVKRYSILHYNCVHYALDVFNATRSHPLQPPLARFEGGTYLTPNGLYVLLCKMRGGSEGQRVIIRSGKAEAATDPFQTEGVPLTDAAVERRDP